MREGVSILLVLCKVISVDLRLFWKCRKIASGNFMGFIGGGNEATELFELEDDKLPLALGSFARFFAALRRRAALLHVHAIDNKTRITQLCKCTWISPNL